MFLCLISITFGMICTRSQVRGELQAALEQRMPERNWGFITKQIGMFSFTGMTPAQVRGVTWASRSTLCLDCSEVGVLV